MPGDLAIRNSLDTPAARAALIGAIKHLADTFDAAGDMSDDEAGQLAATVILDTLAPFVRCACMPLPGEEPDPGGELPF